MGKRYMPLFHFLLFEAGEVENKISKRKASCIGPMSYEGIEKPETGHGWI